MADFWACVIAEFRSLGFWCIIHGPEIWLGFVALCVLSIVLILGVWLTAFLYAKRKEDDDE